MNHRLVELQGLVKGGGSLPGQTDDAQTVRPVGGDLKLGHIVVQGQQGTDVVAGLHARGGQLRVVGENENTVLNGIGVVVGGQAQLL